jgi:hypothetical protein
MEAFVLAVWLMAGFVSAFLSGKFDYEFFTGMNNTFKPGLKNSMRFSLGWGALRGAFFGMLFNWPIVIFLRLARIEAASIQTFVWFVVVIGQEIYNERSLLMARPFYEKFVGAGALLFTFSYLLIQVLRTFQIIK